MTRRAPQARPGGDAIQLRLYVAGDAPNSVAAIANLEAVLAEHTGPRVSLEVIDVLKDPRRGLRDGVLVTPVVVRVAPVPQRRVIGTLVDRAFVRNVLGLGEAIR